MKRFKGFPLEPVELTQAQKEHREKFIADNIARARSQACPHCGGKLRIAGRHEVVNGKPVILRDIVKDER